MKPHGTDEHRLAVAASVATTLEAARPMTTVSVPVVPADGAGVKLKAVSHVWMLYAALGAAAILVYYLLPFAGITRFNAAGVPGEV